MSLKRGLRSMMQLSKDNFVISIFVCPTGVCYLFFCVSYRSLLSLFLCVLQEFVISLLCVLQEFVISLFV